LTVRLRRQPQRPTPCPTYRCNFHRRAASGETLYVDGHEVSEIGDPRKPLLNRSFALAAMC
jgi:hypothetical protein